MSEWISIKDALPKVGDFVVVVSFGRDECHEYDAGEVRSEHDHLYVSTAGDEYRQQIRPGWIDYWMPIPKPPK